MGGATMLPRWACAPQPLAASTPNIVCCFGFLSAEDMPARFISCVSYSARQLDYFRHRFAST